MKLERVETQATENWHERFRKRRIARRHEKMVQQRRAEFEAQITERMNVLERAWQRGDRTDTAYALHRLRAVAAEGAARGDAWWFAQPARLGRGGGVGLRVLDRYPDHEAVRTLNH